MDTMSKKPNSTPTKNSAGNTILFIAVIYNIFSPPLENCILNADYYLKFAVHKHKPILL